MEGQKNGSASDSDRLWCGGIPCSGHVVLAQLVQSSHKEAMNGAQKLCIEGDYMSR